MDLITLFFIFLGVLVLLFLSRILAVAFKVAVVLLAVALVIIFIFGVSTTELLQYVQNILVWAFWVIFKHLK